MPQSSSVRGPALRLATHRYKAGDAVTARLWYAGRMMNPVFPRTALILLAFCMASQVSAQTVSPAGQQHYDLNMYPTMGSGSPNDLSASSAPSLPPGAASTAAPPPPAYSFKDVLANTHGFVETGVSSRGGYDVSGGVSIPILPGKAELDLAAGTGQLAGWGKTPNGKTPIATYDSYSAGLQIHPSDDFSAYIGITGLRLHPMGPTPPYAFGLP